MLIIGSKDDFHFLFLLDFYFHLVEALAIDTNDTRLADKGLRVNHFDESEHVDALVFLSQNTEHLHLLTSIPSVSIKDGNTMIHLRANSIGYLLPFLSEYHELYGLASCIHHIVERIVLHRHHTKAEHHLMSTLQIGAELWEEHTRADDAEVSSYQHVTQRYIRMILVHRGCYDVGTTRRTIVGEDSSQRDTCQHTAYNHRHEVLPLAHQFEGQSVLLLGYQVLSYHQHKIEGEDSEDGLHQELHTQYF